MFSWLGPKGPTEGTSLKSASKAFIQSRDSGVPTVKPIATYKRSRGCCSCCNITADGVYEFLGSFKIMFVGEPGDRPWFNVLLVLIPFAIASRLANWPPVAQFVLALISMMPLAERLGFTTESLADVSGHNMAHSPRCAHCLVVTTALKRNRTRNKKHSLPPFNAGHEAVS